MARKRIVMYHPVLDKETTAHSETKAQILERSGWVRADTAARDVSEPIGDGTPATGSFGSSLGDGREEE